MPLSHVFKSGKPARSGRHLCRVAIALVAVIAFGTIGITLIEGWSVQQSLFFTLITITTVGFSDYDLSEAGQRFTIILLAGGIGVATYSISQLVQSFMQFELARKRKMMRHIQQLHGHFIICGLGRIGEAVCQQLAEQSVPFVAIDLNQERVDEAISHGHYAVHGDATLDSVLESVGVANARGLACVTASDSDNIVITLTARSLNADLFILSRAETEAAVRKLQTAGATRVVSPIRAGGHSIASAIINPNLTEFLEMTGDGDASIAMAEVTIEEASILDGRTVRESVQEHENIVIVAVKHPDGQTRVRPPNDQSLAAGDVLIVAGDSPALGRLYRQTTAPIAA